jgi:cytidine deaminase
MADTSLIAAAVEARLKAYAPYSHFLVGAAVKDEQGKVHAGCNVENAAYPEGTCAEAGAIAAMIMGGGRKIAEAAVVGGGDALVTPCGGCRQKLREFGAPDLVIHVCDAKGKIRRSFTLAELLPESFGPENLSA